VEIEADNTDFIELVSRPEVSSIYVVHVADDLLQLNAHWLVIQPELFRSDPTRGWEPVGDAYMPVFLGSEEQTTIKVHPRDEETICEIASVEDGRSVQLTNFTKKPIEFIRYKHRG
jgi:hypothetical protein